MNQLISSLIEIMCGTQVAWPRFEGIANEKGWSITREDFMQKYNNR